MNIILIFPQADAETGLFIKNAFIGLGHKIVGLFDPKTEPVQEITSEVISLCRRYSVDLVFMSRTSPLIDVVREVKKLSNRPLLTFWNVDGRRDISQWKNLFPMMRECDFHFTTVYGNVKKYTDRNLGHPIWLSQGIDPSVHNCPGNNCGDRTFKYDVSFIGSIDMFHEVASKRVSLLKALMENFTVNTKPVYRREASKVYYTTKVNIGNNAFPDLSKYLSVRDYKIVGAGGFLLTNHVKDIEDIFVIGKEIDVYDSIQDCINKTRYYLSHEKERIDIAIAGHERVHKFYTYKNRIDKVIEVVNNWREGNG